FHWTTAGLPWLPFAESLREWMGKTVRHMALISVKFNLVLMVINLLPVPPLDGGRIMVGLLPRSLAFQLDRLERFGMLIILILIASGLWSHLVRPVLDVFLRFLL
ncbi:MAG: site-2 protease family protein, partial [Syntrophobacteraceae bacterium]|nr:site-2 protease family protein [Syntrophobacteraceae bacterium]